MVRNIVARGRLEGLDAALEIAVPGAQDRVRHRREVFLGLARRRAPPGRSGTRRRPPSPCSSAGRARRRSCAAPRRARRRSRRSAALPPATAGKRQPDAGEQRGEDLARDRRAAGDLARLIGLLGDDAFAGQPGGEDQQRRRPPAASRGPPVPGKTPRRASGSGARNRKFTRPPAFVRIWPSNGLLRPAPGSGSARGCVARRSAPPSRAPRDRDVENQGDEQKERQLLQAGIGQDTPPLGCEAPSPV